MGINYWKNFIYAIVAGIVADNDCVNKVYKIFLNVNKGEHLA